MPGDVQSTHLERRSGPTLLAFALLFTFAAGINAATHHWWDMAGELVLVAALLWIRTWRLELRAP